MPQVTFVDEQSRELQMADTAILALRLNDGLDVAAFERGSARRSRRCTGRRSPR